MAISGASKGMALITGASTGIGAVYADRLAERGYDLILIARKQELLSKVAETLSAETSRRVETLTADLTKAADAFRAPSRTLTAAHTSEFQAVSADTHPRHYNADYAKAHGMPTMLVQPFQLLSLTAPGASLFTHYVGESIAGLTSVSCEFGQDTYVGDTMYPALEIAELKKEGGLGHVLMAIVICNQRGEVVLSGHQKFDLKLS